MGRPDLRSVVLAAVVAALSGCTGSRLGSCGSEEDGPRDADAPRAPVPCDPAPCDPCGPIPPPCRDECAQYACRFFADYVPSIPVAESRAFLPTVAMPPTPFLLTQGEAETPLRGRLAGNATRLSDERLMTDDRGTRFEVDGEIALSSLEWVSPRWCLTICNESMPLHVAVSVHAYSLQYGALDGLRDWVENGLLSADAGVDAGHTPIGREFSATLVTGGPKIELLDSSPMWKTKFVVKVPVTEGNAFGGGVRSSLSFGIVPPAFGTHKESGNSGVAGDVVLAAAWPISDRWRLTGAAAVSMPGDSDALHDLRVRHHDFVGSGTSAIEWWPWPRFGVSLGFTINGPYTRDTGLATDDISFYGNIGILYRITPCVEAHLLFSENAGNQVDLDQNPGDDIGFWSQRDADFSLTFGVSWAM